MRKNTICICYVTFCLLSTIPQNQGAQLLESLNCIRPYPSNNLTCTWTENNISGTLVNMTLKELNKNESACLKKSVTSRTPTHTNWTCEAQWGQWLETDIIIYNFVPERNLETRLNVVEERDEAKPQNLHCNHTDGNITCTWLVRKEIAESIDFDLFYDDDEKECEPKCEISEYLHCHCNITTNSNQNTSALLETIAVKPRNATNSNKSFKLCLIYQLPARNLMINETKTGEVFHVTWKDTTIQNSNFQYSYELCYWNQGDLKVKEVPDYCPGEIKKLENSHDPSTILQIDEHLKSGSSYSLMVHVQLTEKQTRCYQGPWSQWSNVQTLTTKAVPNLILLSILIPVCVIILVMFAVYGYRALARYTKKWDEMIPNPNKSYIVKSLQKTKIESCLPYEDHLYVEPCNNIMMWTSGSKESPHVYHNEKHTSQPSKEHIPEEDTECFILCDPTKEDYPTASIVDGYKSFTDLTNEQESNDGEDSPFTFAAFDGPYLFSENNLL